jgi:hypothetical protein
MTRLTPGGRLFQQLQTFAGQLEGVQINPCEIAAWPRQAFYIAECERVVIDCNHDDRYRAGRFLCGLERDFLAGSEDHVDIAAHQLFHRSREALGVPVEQQEVDREILRRRACQLAQPLFEGGELRRRARVDQRGDADPERLRFLGRGTRLCPEQRQAADQPEKLPPLHSPDLVGFGPSRLLTPM